MEARLRPLMALLLRGEVPDDVDMFKLITIDGSLHVKRDIYKKDQRKVVVRGAWIILVLISFDWDNTGHYL